MIDPARHAEQARVARRRLVQAQLLGEPVGLPVESDLLVESLARRLARAAAAAAQPVALAPGQVTCLRCGLRPVQPNSKGTICLRCRKTLSMQSARLRAKLIKEKYRQLTPTKESP